MSKPLKDTLSSDEKLKYILDQQELGLTRNEIYKLMGYSNIKNIDDFMKRKGYIKENNLFVEGGKCTPTIPQTTKKTENTTVEVIDDVNVLGVLQDISVQNKLLNMLENYDRFNKMLNWYETVGQMEDKSTPIVEVVTGLEIQFEESETIKTSIRVDKDVWEDFKELGESEYKHIANNKLISQALYEFINKYKKN